MPTALSAPQNPQAPTLLIYGSCVSRDAVEQLPPQSCRLIRYIARQSLLSAGHDASAHLPAALGLPHAFQERMVRGDWAGDLHRRLTQHRSADLLIWDLTDERHGVHWFLDGGVVTRSVDALGSESISPLLDPETHIPFGSPLHREGWQEAAAEFKRFLTQNGLFEKTVVLEVPWAEAAVGGQRTPASMGLEPAEANRLYAPYYQVLKDLGFDVLTLEQPVYADSEHQWGLAPFHYAADVYRRITEGLAQRLPGLLGDQA